MAKKFKNIFRKKILKLLKGQKEEDRLTKSRVIREKLFAIPEFKKAKTILFYASFDGEVETFSMMKQAQKLGKSIVLPRILKDQKILILSLVKNLTTNLTKGPYGISHPKLAALKVLNPNDIDLAIVPGVAFDSFNNRLGRGAGYYDRFLSQLPKEIPTIGLAFDFQVVDRLPHQESHDIPVTCVITN